MKTTKSDPGLTVPYSVGGDQTTDVNCNGQPIDRSGVHWCLTSMPEIKLRKPSRDNTAAFGLTRPNIWSIGGDRISLTIELTALIPIGADMPDVNEIAEHIIAALPSRPV